MNRRRVMACLAAGLLTLGPMVAPVMAQDIGDVLVAQLRDQGFAVQSLETTWLGRLRILATRGGGQREIIVNPRTGEILRDIFTGHSGGATILDPVARNSGGGSGGGLGTGSGKGSAKGSGKGVPKAPRKALGKGAGEGIGKPPVGQSVTLQA